MLAALKPSRRRIGATVLIILTTLIYGAFGSAIREETKKQMSAAFLGEPIATKIKQISEAFPCERDKKIAELGTDLVEKNSDNMFSVRNKLLSASFIILFICAYISACIILPRKLSCHAT